MTTLLQRLRLLLKLSPAGTVVQRAPIPAAVERAWAWRLEADLDPDDGIPAVMAQWPAVEEVIDATRQPESSVSTVLKTALDVACGSYDHSFVQTHLSRAIALSDEVLKRPDRWGERWPTESGERGLFMEARSLACAWSRDDEIDAAYLLEAAEDMLSCADRRWHGLELQQQSLYLRGIQCLLMAGEKRRARALLLNTRRRFGVTQRYFEWTRNLVAFCTGPDSPAITTEDPLWQFDALFEPMRHPAFGPLGHYPAAAVEESRRDLPPLLFESCRAWSFQHDRLLRLRLAVIRWRYVLGEPARGHWRQIIGQMNPT